MATGYEVLTGKDGRVVVVLHRTCKISKDEILALLAESGIEPPNVTFVEPENIAECGDLSGACVIIPLDDAACDQAELEVAGRQCATAGGRVVVLFGPESSYESLHPIADKYGTQCDWSADRLKGCVAGGAEAPRDPAGNLVERPEPREVICRR